MLGGKWTTFRKMGEDTVDSIIKSGILPDRKSTSEDKEIYDGSLKTSDPYIHDTLPYTWQELSHYVKNEWVEHAEDLLCRRTRCILLNKKGTLAILDQAIDLISEYHGYDDIWKKAEKERFLAIADCY